MSTRKRQSNAIRGSTTSVGHRGQFICCWIFSYALLLNQNNFFKIETRIIQLPNNVTYVDVDDGNTEISKRQAPRNIPHLLTG